jgi:hypothetical protein
MNCKRRDPLRWIGALVVALTAMMVCADSRADARLPLQLQAQLVGRLGTFDRNFQNRAGAVAHVLVVHRGGNAESRSEASSFAKATTGLREVGGLPARVEELEYTDGPSLAARCRSQKVALIYFAVGLESEMPRVASALAGVDVLTVGATAQHAESGAVVGFGLDRREARPRLVLNLRSARAQNVEFKAELLKLARIVN